LALDDGDVTAEKTRDGGVAVRDSMLGEQGSRWIRWLNEEDVGLVDSTENDVTMVRKFV
jgi:hypothetical protein